MILGCSKQLTAIIRTSNHHNSTVATDSIFANVRRYGIGRLFTGRICRNKTYIFFTIGYGLLLDFVACSAVRLVN